MKQRLKTLFVPQNNLIDDTLVDTETLYLFRVKLLQAILLTASIVGLATGILEIFNLLPIDVVYTPIVVLYGVVNFIAYLMLRRFPYGAYTFSMHFCILSALTTFSVMSLSLLYDEFRLIWFFLLSFASFMLGGKWYGLSITVMILTSVFAQFFTIDSYLSVFGMVTFTSSLLTFNAFSLLFLNKIEKDAHIMQKHIAKEAEKRRAKEQVLQNMQEENIINLKNDYLWDEKSKTLTYEQKHIQLTQKEQTLLSLLLERKNACVSFEDIQAHVWEGHYEDDISIASVKLQITQLRKKLPKGCIKNVYGAGYILHA